MALPGIAAAGAQIIGGIFGNRSRKREARRQRKFSLDMWNRQNAYNTPANQMQRLKDAGLNPALMYGQGNVGNAEKAMQYQQPQIENVGAGIGQTAAAGAQLSLINAQKRNIEADTRKKDKEAGLTWEQTVSQIIDNEIKDKSKHVFIQKHAEDLNLIKASVSREQAVAKWEQWKAKLSDNNVNANDNFLLRLASEWYHSMGEGESVKSFFNDPEQYTDFAKWLSKEAGKKLIDGILHRQN
jgi:hypothetical protein